jgi:hypothetical protein
MEKRMAKYKIDKEFIVIVGRKEFAVRGIVVMKWILQERDMRIRSLLNCLSVRVWQNFVNSSRRCIVFLDQLSNHRLLQENPVYLSSLHNDRIRYKQGRNEVCCMTPKLWHLRDAQSLIWRVTVLVFTINKNIKLPTIVNNNNNNNNFAFANVKSNCYRSQACPSVLHSIRMGQLCSHWTDFHEIWYLNIFRKSVETIQFSLKYDTNNGCFT